MGRELKRVPLDFRWPCGVPWDGYVNPYEPKKCPMCLGTGADAPSTVKVMALQTKASTSGGRLEFHTAWSMLKARSKLENFHFGCSQCGDTGKVWDTQENKSAYQSWEEVDPPTGEGYQLWMCRTGNWPVSPVFKTLEELATWCELNATTFAEFRATAQEWVEMLAQRNVHHFDGRMRHY